MNLLVWPERAIEGKRVSQYYAAKLSNLRVVATQRECAMNKIVKSIVAATLIFTATQANAATYDFFKIGSSANTNIASQLKLDVTQSGTDALFKISNNGSVASNIAEIYFDFGTTNFFAVPGGITVHSDSGAGVLMTNGANPNNLPGGNSITPKFVAEDAFDNGNDNSLGVAPGEWIQFLGTFTNGNFAALSSALASGNFRVGLHVRSIGTSDGSDAYVNTSVVPLPAAAWLFGSALIGFVGWSNRRRV